MLHALEEETGRFFHFAGSEGLPLDHFAIVEEGAREEIEEQSVPFREGEEVHVDIVEPHMYYEDDAVAKVDGYLIEVADGIASSARRCSCGSRTPAAPRRAPCSESPRRPRRPRGAAQDARARGQARRARRRRHARAGRAEPRADAEEARPSRR